MVASNTQPRRLMFPLGKTVATPGALAALANSGEQPDRFIIRHATGDWGEVDREDWALNDEAVAHEGDEERMSRVLSAYTTKAGEKFWIITEADRSSTCLLLPDEY